MEKKLELTARLQMVADLVPDGAKLADIGTDHAYLPAVLMLEGKISTAIAADLRQGPLERAKATVQNYGLQGKISFRLCDGLKGIKPEEADTVVIAGMGGETISMILEAAPWTRERGTKLVLQPMSSMLELRIWLEKNGYQIQSEHLAQEGNTIYTAFLVQAGEMPALTPAECWVGRNHPGPLRKEWLEHWERRICRAKEGMERSRQESVQIQIKELEEVLQELGAMKEAWLEWQQ